jgi:hypothetical protein
VTEKPLPTDPCPGGSATYPHGCAVIEGQGGAWAVIANHCQYGYDPYIPPDAPTYDGETRYTYCELPRSERLARQRST